MEERIMSGANAFKFVMLPPQNEVYRAWAARLAAEVPEARIVLVEDEATAARETVVSEAGFGRAPVARYEVSGNLQRSYQWAYHGFRAGVRAGAACVHPSAGAA